MLMKATMSLSTQSIHTQVRGATGRFKPPGVCTLRSGLPRVRGATPQPSLFRLPGDPIELAALKKAEDSDDTILRLYEPHGNRANITIESAIRSAKCIAGHYFGRKRIACAIHDRRQIKLSFRPFQMMSLRLEFVP